MRAILTGSNVANQVKRKRKLLENGLRVFACGLVVSGILITKKEHNDGNHY